jgi:mitochondrial cardiolipin hydrolase
MDTTALDRLLRQTLTSRLETADRKTLADWADRHPGDADRAVAHGRAFVLARSSVAAEVSHVVEWLEEVVRVLARPAADAPTGEQANAFFSPGKACIHEVLRQFDLARQSCDVCVFTITDDRITDAIIRANARGVAVRIITDDEKSHDLGSDIDKLQMCGIPCKMDVGNVAHMHHKFALFDGRRLMTGSFNWTRSASEQNEESLLVTPDPVLVKLFTARFENLWGRMKEVVLPPPWTPAIEPREGM